MRENFACVTRHSHPAVDGSESALDAYMADLRIMMSTVSTNQRIVDVGSRSRAGSVAWP